MTRFPLLIALVLSGCQCANVPEKALCFSNEPCARDAGVGGGSGGGGAGGGGAADAGGGTGGGGGEAGGMGGSGGGGVVDAGPDPGFCLDWPCVTSKLGTVQAVPIDFTLLHVPVPAGVLFNCPEHWRGGILLPNRKVLAVPYCADHLLLIDPEMKSVTVVGGSLPPIAVGLGHYAGGVLGCDGRAYLMPFGSAELGRVSSDGNFTVTPLALTPNPAALEAQGGVVDRNCAIWITTVNETARIGVSPTSTLYSPSPRPPMPQRSALVRVEDSAWVPTSNAPGMASVFKLSLVNGAASQVSTASSIATTFRGGAIGASGNAYFVDSTTGSVLKVPANGGASFRMALLGSGFGYPTFRGDGFIYVLGDRLLAIADVPDGGMTTQLATELQDAGAAGVGAFAGLVATPTGVLVAIPSAFPEVVFLVPNGGNTAPAEVLLSPFFNKL